MAARLNPYLRFNGNAREAMEFYRDVLGGELTLSTFGEFGTGEGAPPADGIMHAMLVTPSGFTLMASDTPPGMPYSPGDTVSVSLSGDDADDLRRYWAGISDGGTVEIPLQPQMWGDEFGACVDRFGIGWMVNIAGGQEG